MKKLMCLLAAVALLLSFAACSQPAKEDDSQQQTAAPTEQAEQAEQEEQPDQAAGEGKTLAMLHISMADEFHATVDSTAKELFADSGIEVVSSSCDYDTGVQLQQLEDYISMEPDYIYIATQDSGVLKDAMKQARENGIFLFYYGDDPNDPEMYDALLMADEYTLGDMLAQEAARWVDETFPDAEPGSVEAATFNMSAYSTISIGKRMDALKNIVNYTDKVVLVDDLDLGSDTTATKAQELVDACMISHPDVKVLLSPASFITSAANESLMRTSGIDYENFFLGTVDFNSTLASLIEESANNESVIRCAIGFQNPAYPMYDIVTGTREIPEDKLIALDAYGVTAENLAEYTD